MNRHFLLIGMVALVIARGQEAPVGAIAGQVMDDAGTPLNGWSVRAVQWEYRRGIAQLKTLSEARSDREGRYRLENLEPGRVLVVVDSPVVAGLARVATVGRAEEVVVSAGSVVGGRNIRVVRVPVFNMRGRVAGAAMLSVRPADAESGDDAIPVSAGAGGVFDIGGLPAGRYVVEQTMGAVAGRAEVSIVGRDVVLEKLSAEACGGVTGIILLDGRPWVMDAGRAPVSLQDVRRAVAIGGRSTGPGMFEVGCEMGGTYRVAVNGPPDAFVRRVRVNGKAVAEAVVELWGGVAQRVEIELESRGATLRGRVEGAAMGTPVTVWRAGDDFNSTATVVADGRFEFRGLAPGDYRIAAWDQLKAEGSTGVQTVAAFRRRFEGVATEVKLVEGVTGEVAPVLVSRAEIEAAGAAMHLSLTMVNAVWERVLRKAARSPESLARFIEGHPVFDWAVLSRVLGVSAEAQLPCGQRQVMMDRCSTEMVTVGASDKVLIVLATHGRAEDVYLRFVADGAGEWRCSGATTAWFDNNFREHRLARVFGRPFLVVASDNMQTGIATERVREQWFDLRESGLRPVFELTRKGQQSRFAFGVGREVESTVAGRVEGGREVLEVRAKVRFVFDPAEQVENLRAIYGRQEGGAFRIERAFRGSPATSPGLHP